jgi:PAS domain S-box-containing protein
VSKAILSAVLLFSLPLLCFGQNIETATRPENVRSTLVIVITALLLIQTLLIVGLQRSRSHHKKAKRDLQRAQRELEQGIVDRTNKLRTINNQLYDEIAKHEITEELLRETQDYLHSIINSMPSMLIGVTRQGTVTHWNSATEHTTGIIARDALGQSFQKVFKVLPIDIKDIENSIDNELPLAKENMQQGMGNQATYSDVAIYPLLSSEITGAVIRIDDVTLRVRLENMMIQNEKMMSLGEMAAGMAHEINNPLSAIINSLQNLERRVSDELEPNHTAAEELGISIEQLRAYMAKRDLFSFMESIRDAGERAANIVTNMLEFSRGNTRKRTAVNINELIEHSLSLAYNTLELLPAQGDDERNADGIRVIKDFAQGLPTVPCSTQEIQQVLLNLLRNAKQSFDHAKLTPGEQAQISLKTYLHQDSICIEIKDNGAGMEQAVSRHIFEPFYTTKGVGEGTGLGLSVSYFIITEHHDGTIEVESESGKGSCFRIKLPIISIRSVS